MQAVMRFGRVVDVRDVFCWKKRNDLVPKRCSPIGGVMKREDRVSYVMLFCALLLVRNSKATLEESMRIVPLVGSARDLASELATRAVPATA